MNTKLYKIKNNDKILFLFSALLFGLIISQCVIFNDDLRNSEMDLIHRISLVVNYFYSWSSRLLIDTIMMTLLSSRFLFFLYCFISMYVLEISLFDLFLVLDETRFTRYIIAILWLFPFYILKTAGWIATTATYFGPSAFGVFSLIPITQKIGGKNISWKRFLLTIPALLYSGNNEQMAIILFGSYFCFILYDISKHHMDWKIIFLFFLSLFCLLFFLFCPGNWNRLDLEISWFPTFYMLGIIDKAEIGLTTTFHWIFCEENNYIIILLLFMTLLVWKKYEGEFYRFLSLVPLIFACLIGPFQNILERVFPNFAFAFKDINYYGAFNVASKGKGPGVVQFSLFLFMFLLILIEFILINDSIKDLIIDLVLLLLGLSTRIMLGFSPTVYASSARTFTNFLFCLIVILAHTYVKFIDYFKKDSYIKAEKQFLWMSTLLGICNLIFIVASDF